MSRMTDKRRKEKPTKEQVQGWIKSGDWGGPGIEPLINNACWVAEAYLECLGEIDRLKEELVGLLAEKSALTVRIVEQMPLKEENRKARALLKQLEAVMRANGWKYHPVRTRAFLDGDKQ